MIQRIQSLWLFLAALAMTLMLFMPLARILGGAEQFMLTAYGFESVSQSPAVENIRLVRTIAMTIVIAIAALLPLVTIFLFKDRLLQLRLCLTSLVLAGGTILFEAFYAYRGWKSLEGFETIFKFDVAFFFPILAILFLWLATRGIKKDISLIKSLDRIR